MVAFPEGTPCWVDAMVPDLGAGKRFYGGLFGWTFGDSRAGYGHGVEAFHDGRSVAALVPKADGRMPTVWNLYFASRDAAATAARITEAGGRVITRPTEAGELGVTATAVDPGGAVFGVWQGGTRAGFGKRGRPVSYAWGEVYTRHAERVDPFYEAVFGWTTRALDTGNGMDFAVWSPPGRPAGIEGAVAGRGVIDSRFPPEMPAHFLVYFAVADCDETAAKAVRLGGRVILGPEDTPYGRFAVLVDDQGASFAAIDLARAAR
ncbi:VOC family protein [Streptomyces pathocidini]|uniref:VOC family protein n=1 Tax=Streptomyces pathocidini TaxID=1650571 RepID=A0ABW7USY1_9ACTN|nr:VOC family protein [Streptomyces pathocidini]